MFNFVLQDFFLGWYAWTFAVGDREQFLGGDSAVLMADLPLVECQGKSILLGCT